MAVRFAGARTHADAFCNPPGLPVLMQGTNERAGSTHALRRYCVTSVIQLQNVS